MEFTSSTDSDPSVVAANMAEDRDITLSNSNTPQPVLASTAHKVTLPKECRDMVNKIQHLAGSYVESVGSLDSDKQDPDNDKDFRFLDFLKTSLSNSAGSSRSVSPKLSACEVSRRESDESSLGMLDLDQIAGSSLVHVDSNVSLGSWLDDMMPLPNRSLRKTVDNSAVCEIQDAPVQTTVTNENNPLASRYFMTDSQLGGFSDSVYGTPTCSMAQSRIDNQELLDKAIESDRSGKEASQVENASSVVSGGPDSNDAFSLDKYDEDIVGSAMNFSGTDFQAQLGLQHEILGDQEFAGNASDILNKDEEIFVEEHKLMINSGDEESEFTGTGFTTLRESQSKMELCDAKMSIGTYMASRSEKIGELGHEQRSVERPSFGWKIRSPSPRKPVALQTSNKGEETYVANSNSKCDTSDDTLENSASDKTLSEKDDQNQRKSSQLPEYTEVLDDNDSNESRDTVTDPSMLSLSEAIMNMSTSVNNEELARAIIEITKKKEMKMNERKQRIRFLACNTAINSMSKNFNSVKSSSKENADVASKKSNLSSLPDKDADCKPKRKSKIPLSVKSPSPAKPLVKKHPMSKENKTKKKLDVQSHPSLSLSSSSLIGKKNQMEKSQIQDNEDSIVSFTPPPDSNDDVTTSKTRPLQSLENITDASARRTETGQVGEQKVMLTQSSDPMPAEIQKSVDGMQIPMSELYRSTFYGNPDELNKEKHWKNIMQESFMHDAPEQDEALEKSASEPQEMPTFSNDRDSVCFPDEVSTKYLLSSTRTDHSLLRGSLSRESIEELHKKLRIRSAAIPNNQVPSSEGRSIQNDGYTHPKEKFGSDNSRRGEEISGNVDSKKTLQEDRTWRRNDSDDKDPVGPLSHSSPDWKTDGRFSEDFQEMLPSMTMSFGEMATIQEHQFDLTDLNEKQEGATEQRQQPAPKNQAKVQKLDVITEEAETTQDTTLSGQSTASAESQSSSEMSHPTQHSTTIPPHMQMIHPSQHMYPPYQHPQYPRLPASLSSTSLPASFPHDRHYRHHLDGPYHSVPTDYHQHRTANVYPHSFGPYPLTNACTSHPHMHGPITPYPLEQPSMACSAEMGLNHTTSTTMYPQSGYQHPSAIYPPRSAPLDGRFPSLPDSCCHSATLRTFEALSVPSDLLFSGIRCVSVTSSAKLLLSNKSERWIQAELNIVSPAVDCCFSVDAKPIIGPHDMKNVEISFLPKKEGQFEAILEVASFPVASEGSVPQPTRAITNLVNLKASAESPNAEFMGPDNKRIVDFGETLCETSKYLPLRIYNKGAADLPVCIILCAKSQDRKCFAISDSSTIEWNDQEKRSQSILRTIVHPGNRITTVWVHCKIPPKYCEASEPPKNISAQVYMEIENSEKQSLDTVVLDTISVEVNACVAKLHAPKNMQPMNFICAKDSSQTLSMPVKNCGNVSARVTFSLLDNENVLFVSPQHALLAAGEQVEVSVQFKPDRLTPNQLKSTFLMKIEPNGTKYEITINTVTTEPQLDQTSRQSFTDSSHSSLGDMPSLLTNKSHVCWGGVTVGQSLQQRVVLRTSNGARKPLPMRLMIKGDDAACFQILKEDDRSREELCSRQEIVMLAGQDKVVKILFGPTKCKMALAKLEIKAPVDQVPSTKFTIPLSGYGGRSDVKVEGLESVPKDKNECYSFYRANAIISEYDNQKFKIKFTVKNNTSRHAFIKSVIYSDQECLILRSPSAASCSPAQFILPKHTSRTIMVSLDRLQHSERTSYSRNGKDFIGCICLWHNDEIVRHLLKNALGKLGPSAITKCLSESNPLRQISFDGIFEGEGSLDLEEDLSQVKPQLGDVQVFYTSIRKTVIEVFGPRSSTPLLEMVEPGKTNSLQSNTGRRTEAERNLSSHLHYRRSNSAGSSNSWELSPEHIVLSSPRLDSTTDASKMKIVNRSSLPLKFDIAWSRNYLTITPHSGQVDPGSILIILLNANPSLATRRDALPWVGNVQVSTQNGRDTKVVRVQIRDDVAPLDTSVQPATPVPRVPLKARYSEPISTDCFTTPAASSGASRISGPTRDISKNKIMLTSATVDFGSIPVKSSANSCLEFTNVCPSSIRWLLTSFAPAYVKDIEPTGDLYRSTYAAFIFSHTSGLLEPGVKVRIPVTFNPMSEGNYSQFWDLEHHEAADSAAVSLNKVRIQVVGQGTRSTRGPQPILQTDKAKEISGIYVSEDQVHFPDVVVNESTIVKIPVKNRSKESHNVRFINVKPPFHITHQRHTIRPMSYACLPVSFKPTSKGEFNGTLVIQAEGAVAVSVKLFGKGV